RLPASDCIQIGISLSAALENLHQHGLIHRDVKPGNIVFVNGAPKLADIGLVTDLDMTISYVGTEGFIPPEGPISARADVYGLGKVLYEISTGKGRLEYPELPEKFAEIPDWEQLLELNAVITKACEPDPARRYRSASEMRAELEWLAAGNSVRRHRSIKRKSFLAAYFVAILAIIGLLAAGVFYFPKHQKPQPQMKVVPAKLPLPDASQLAQGESKLKAIYSAQLNVGTTAARQQAAVELLNRSSTETDPAMKLAALRLAARLASQSADFSRAMEICDQMDSEFQMDVLPVKADILSQAATYAGDAGSKRRLADICVTVGFQAIADDDYTSAMKISGLAKSGAQSSGDKHLIWEADFLGDEMERCSTAFERVKPFAAVLRANPNDPAANLAMGKFLCFVKNDWSGGLPCLARSGDKSLATIADEELNHPPATANERIALGNSWWDGSASASNDEKIYYQKRARYWYLKGMAASNQPDKDRFRQALAARINGIPTQPAEVRIVSRVNGTEFIDIYSDEVQWQSSRRGTVANKINQVSLGDFSASDLEIIKNSGATRLMPDTVDFSTAQLNLDHKPSRGGHADLEVFDDHARVILSHRKTGAATLDVTVTFGNP
ncbi:MAG TPA: protein kinase, partial [Candidatus Baltobacteraceae bacterium]|nr:protein kinase [Candidatus Baltobacteraceae bacterium]